MKARSLEKSSSILKSVVLDLNLNARMFLRRGRICLSNASEKILIPLGWAAETVFSLYKSDHLKTWKWEIFQLLFHLYQVSCSPDVVFKPSPFTSSLDLAEMINLRRNWFSFFFVQKLWFLITCSATKNGINNPISLSAAGKEPHTLWTPPESPLCSGRSRSPPVATSYGWIRNQQKQTWRTARVCERLISLRYWWTHPLTQFRWTS